MAKDEIGGFGDCDSAATHEEAWVCAVRSLRWTQPATVAVVTLDAAFSHDLQAALAGAGYHPILGDDDQDLAVAPDAARPAYP